jgi:Iron/zinc purple acid phosphatase-like protein C
MALIHEPEFDSGPNGSNTNYLSFWNDFYGAGVELVLSGHSHLYERFGPQTPTGASDPAHGVVQMIVGTGGNSLDNFHTIRPNSIARNNTDFGVVMLTLHDSSYDWQFVPVAGGTYSDSGSANCHSAP